MLTVSGAFTEKDSDCHEADLCREIALRRRCVSIWLILVFCLCLADGSRAAYMQVLRNDASAVASRLTPVGRLDGTKRLHLAISLPLRNQQALRDLLRQSPADPSAHELPHVHPDHSLSLALERMGSSGQMVLPVVSRANVRQLLGVVVLDDILDAYGVSRPRESGEREKQPDV